MSVEPKTPPPVAPIRLIPRQQPTVWGGHLLETMFGKPHSDNPVGESWEIWEDDRIAGGPYEGLTLQEIAEIYPDHVLGPVPLGKSHGRFPLLTKFIDAQEPLSVQVHPNDRQAQEFEGQPNGKTEAWHIIRAAPGAWIIHGLERPVDRDELRKHLEGGTADDLLHKISVKSGDTVFMPAGTIHAIGPGVLLHEVQQTSEVTYRLYDWNRQAQGSRRELHLDRGIAVSFLKPSPNVLVKPLSWQQGDSGVTLLLATEYFTAKRLELAGLVSLDTRARSFHILTVFAGRVAVLGGRVGSANAVAVGEGVTLGEDAVLGQDLAREHVSTGQSLLVPAALGSYDLIPEPEATVLVEYVEDIQAEVVPELQAQGFTAEEISKFLEQFAPVS